METIVKPTHDVVVVGGGIAGVSAAVATVLFVRAGMMIDAYQKLLQVGEFRKEQKAQKELADRVGTVYWCVVLAVYLGVSFLSGAWWITWLIWPVTAVLYPALLAILGIKTE